MPINNPYGGYLGEADTMSGPGMNPYAGYLTTLQKQRASRQQQTVADALTELRKIIASMPSASPQVPQPGYLPPSIASDDVYSPGDYEKGVTGIESGGDWKAVNPTSGAGGRYQFIEPTWSALAKQGLPLTPEGRTSDTPEGRQQQMLAFKALTEQNAQQLKKALGRMPTHAELYGAHLLGPGWATAVLQNPQTPLKAVLPESFIKANPFLDGIDGQTMLQMFGKRFNR